MADNFTANAGSGGDTFAADDVGGVKYQRVKAVWGADGAVNDTSAAAPMPVALTTSAITLPTSVTSITPPTLTKGTQGATGFSVQPLKDAGRVVFAASTVIAGVTAVTSEAVLSMVPSRDFVDIAAATTHPVTNGKRLRLTSITCGFISTAAAVNSVRFVLRVNPSGAAIVTSPIVIIVPLSSGPAVAQQGNEITVPLPDGLELSGTHQFTVSQVAQAVTGTVWCSVNGFEY